MVSLMDSPFTVIDGHNSVDLAGHEIWRSGCSLDSRVFYDEHEAFDLS
jgi:hypothetical protein